MLEDLLINASDEDLKMCTGCKCMKLRFVDFYMQGDKVRSECKRCVIKRNVACSLKRKAWKKKKVSPEKDKAYRAEYYRQNKEKFAEYRKTFKEKHPNYYQKYFREKKAKASESENPGDESGIS